MLRNRALVWSIGLVAIAWMVQTQVAAQQSATPAAPMEYGLSIGTAEAKQAAAAAIAEVTKVGSMPDAVAIVDAGGLLVYFERMDNTQLGSAQFAIDKARSALLYRRPTKVFEDAVAGGRNAILGLRDAVPIDGGVPIVAGGKIIGAIGASGGTSAQDGQVARTGAAAVK
jgi:glc operon protein GlcG